jgi:hypothetical protein
MGSSDYPHGESSSPRGVELVEGIPEADRRKITDNLQRRYDIELPG